MKKLVFTLIACCLLTANVLAVSYKGFVDSSFGLAIEKMYSMENIQPAYMLDSVPLTAYDLQNISLSEQA